MSNEELSSAKRRRVARACDTCRRKKVRCDGVQPCSDPPSCTNCKAYGYECSFIDAPKKRGPPKGYIEALETRLQRMESILGNLSQSSDLPEGTMNSNLEWINVNESNFKASQDSVGKNHSYDPSSAHAATTSNGPVRKYSPSSDTDDGLSSDNSEYNGDQYDLNDSMGQLAIDESGHTRYLGNSSGIFLLKLTKKVTNGQAIKIPCVDWNVPIAKRVTGASIASKLPPKELCDKLLNIYWTQFYPHTPFIDRVDFMKKYNDLETNSSSIVLLFAILATASRCVEDPAVRKDLNLPSTAGEEYFNQAKELINDEFDNATITTIQALVLLASHQQGLKNTTTWLYIGMAIRLAQDMGLHRDSSKWNIDAREAEVRKRVWWACVVSDRLVGATFGRPLAISELDCDVEYPVHGLIPEDPPYAVDSWNNLIKLSLILGRVLSHIYGVKSKQRSNSTNGSSDSVLASLDAELTEWRENLPPELQLDSPNNAPEEFLINRRIFLHIKYYTIQILLHRPHIRGPKSKAPPSSIPSLTICTMAANHITHILHRLMREGKLKAAWPYSLYSFFTAATMHIINALSGDDRFREVAKYGLRMTIKCLEYMKPYWFATERCLFVMNDLLKMQNINLNGTPDVNSYSNASPYSKKRRLTHGDDPKCLKSKGIIDTGDNPFPEHYATGEIPNVAFSLTPVSSQTGSQSTSIQEYSISMRQQHMISNVHQQSLSPYEQTPSPDSTSSTSSFIHLNDFTMNMNNELFPPNADAFSPEVSSLLFDDIEGPMGNSDSLLSLPSTIDWMDWTFWTECMTKLQPSKTGTNDPHL